MNERYEWIDNLRGLAIVLMILGHVIGGLVRFDGENNLLRTIIYQFHMPLMFMISGYVSKDYCIKINKVKDYIFFFRKQLITLYVPYLIWGTCFWGVKFFIYQGNETVTVKELIRLPYDFSAWVPGWFLLALIGIRLIDRLFQELNVNLHVQGTIWMLLLVVSYLWSINSVIDCCLEFGFYYYIGRVLRKGFDTKIQIICSIVCTVWGGCVFARGYEFSKPFLAIGICFTLFCVYKYYNIDTSCLRQIGKYSMIPYVLQAYFTIPVRIVLGIMKCDCFVIYVLLEMSIAIAMSVLVISLIKDNKKILFLFYPQINEAKNKRFG